MDINNQRPAQAGEPSMEAGDWRSQVQPDSRRRIVGKITETLGWHLPFEGEEGLRELENLAVRFEEKTYVAASSRSDYLRKIALKMVTMETNYGVSPTPPSNLITASRDQVLMDINNQRPAQGGEPSMEAGDWRSHLQPDSRRRIVGKITETLVLYLHFEGEEGLRELVNLAVRFEEKIYVAASSQSDYLRKIALKMVTMETKSGVSRTPPSNLKRHRVLA